MKKFLAGFFLIGFSCGAFAQSSLCEETLNQATDEFNAGHFYEIPGKLKACIDNNDFTREQRVRAYLLLSQVYLIIDDPASAEDSYLKLLTADPEYIATEEKDPIDVVYLSRKFTSTPIFTPHLRIGLNTTRISDRDYLTATPGQIERQSLRANVQLGGGFDWNINNNWSLCAEGLLSTRGFRSVAKNIFPDTAASDSRTATERMTFVDVPLYLKFSASKGQLRPYGYAGVAGNFLLSSKVNLVAPNKTASESGINVRSAEGPDVSTTYLRKRFSKSIIVGGGVKYKIGKDFIFVDARLMIGLSNMTVGNVFAPENRSTSGIDPYDNQTGYMQTYYGFVPANYLRFDNVSISVGYIRPLYNPRKIKKPTVKGVLHMFDRKKKA